MKIIFVRHGEGMHTVDLPKSLQIYHPFLTKKGKEQVRLLRDTLPLESNDLLVVSPTVRTLETASLWSENVDCVKIVHPAVAPRIFPYKDSGRTLPCDQMLSQNDVRTLFPQFLLKEDELLWHDGINVISPYELQKAITNFLKWCMEQKTNRICVVSHDGTITAYREHINKETLTRKDFLNEAMWYEIILSNMEERI
ncbi:histidine phosphatase family protein [Bacillus manliponensis]|uniref:histidine phosphatase family protein n=1 Tax=Bacillus manliponensis TaxID=574376 RepID=UPI0035124D28